MEIIYGELTVAKKYIHMVFSIKQLIFVNVLNVFCNNWLILNDGIGANFQLKL